jgi:hypothetical protein
LTTTYTPQQNRVIERKNRTIMNLVWSMLLEKKIPKMFWPEAVNWTVNILNRSKYNSRWGLKWDKTFNWTFF